MVDVSTDMPLVGETGFAVGGLLGRSLAIFRQDFAKFVLLTGIFLIPDLVVSLLFPDIEDGSKPRPAAQSWKFVLVMLQVLADVAVIFVALARINGRTASIGDALRESGLRFRSALFTSVLQGFAFLFGLVLLIAPGLIAFAMMYVALPVCVAEQTGATASINRSSALTKGNRWKVFGVSLVANGGGLLLLVIPSALATLTGMPTLVAFVGYLAQVVYLAFVAIVSTVTYQTLRVAKEGPPAESLAEVFA